MQFVVENDKEKSPLLSSSKVKPNSWLGSLSIACTRATQDPATELSFTEGLLTGYKPGWHGDMVMLTGGSWTFRTSIVSCCVSCRGTKETWAIAIARWTKQKHTTASTDYLLHHDHFKLSPHEHTVRSDVEERFAEERLAWNDKNVPAWPQNSSVLWNFGPIHSALYEIRTW